MPVADLMMDGLKLMALGMGIVFVFLLFLVLLMTLMSRVAQAIGDDSTAGGQTLAVPAPSAQMSPLQEDMAVPAVIAAAVHRYRTAHRRIAH